MAGDEGGLLEGGVDKFILSFQARNIKILDSSNIKVLYLNINRLRNKIERLELFMSLLGVQFDVVILCETFSSNDSVQFLNLNGYNAFHYIRESEGGGLVIFVRDCLFAEVVGSRFLREQVNSNDCEFLIVKLINFNINICATYRRPINNQSIYLDKLDKVLCKFDNLLVAGDLNIDWFTDSPYTLRLKSVLHSNGFNLFNDVSQASFTRKSHLGSSTLIDYFFSDLHFPKCTFAVGDNDISDHRFLILGMQKEEIIKSTRERIYKTTNHQIINDTIPQLIHNDFDDYHSNLIQLVNKNTTSVKKVVYSTTSKDWFTAELRVLIDARDYLYKMKLKFPDTHYYQERFIHYRNLIKREVQMAKQTYYSRKIQVNISDSRKTWDVMREVIYNKPSKKSCQIPSILFNNQSYTGSFDKANLINDFFSSIGVGTQTNGSSLNLSDEQQSLQSTMGTSRSSLTFFEPTTSEEISRVIQSLQLSSSAGYDNISTLHLRSNIDLYANYLSTQINKSFQSGIFPTALKIARVIPIYKSGSRNVMDNYRPISILSSFSKVYEKVIYNRLEAFLLENSLIDKNQFGFLKNSSTVSASTCLINSIVNQTDQRLRTGCIFLDIKKAFDSVNHTCLIHLLSKLNITGSALNLLSNFLTNRSQYVELEQCKSDLKGVQSGVPQGSILGPLLFLIYINGIFKLKLHSYIQLYADDAVLVISDRSFLGLKSKMSQDLTNISIWLKSIGLSLNTNKSKFLIIRKINRDNRNLFDTVEFQNTSISSCTSYNYLGLIIDENLNWQLHLEKICSKVSSFAYAFRKIRHTLDFITLKKLYYAYVHTHFTYLLPVWGSCPVTYLRNLQYLQNKILKTINFLRYDTPTVNLYSNDFLSINQQFEYESIFLIFKMTKGLLKTNFNFVINFDVTGVSTRSSNMLRLPFFRSASGQKSFYYQGISSFNKLPPTIKVIPSVSIFKSRLKDYISNQIPIIRTLRC